MVYQWKSGAHMKADAQKVGEELEQIEHRDAATVVAVARKHKKSELHKCFTWDDTEAAEEYRLEQARRVCRFIVTDVDVVGEDGKESKTVKIRVYESVQLQTDEDDDDDETRQPMVYMPTLQALKNDDFRNQILTGLYRTICEAERTAETYEYLAPKKLSIARCKLVEARQAMQDHGKDPQ